MDRLDRELLASFQEDATQSYATLGKAVGLSTTAAHERIRKLRESGVIRRTTVEIDPVACGRPVSAFALVEGTAWMGEPAVGEALAAIAEIEQAHIVAGAASLMVKIRATSNEHLQQVLRRIYDIDGVTGTKTIVVLETFFERAFDPREQS
ncbi:Lrp/AsnC family transcriptional regulator [Allokutzneria sp. A3M-2-11 16]|uniref:Lrp/AsnC family transcriptional regulator n=1 Tax=Allokutzneria sp. A3M-2-11 16 TaxID=2962043 RepID=UPI0020B7B01F|nr:Lrp/AsnC family transcriptional regulator [Allokutzneria sp. A3M-2-11 16]MCP3805496.1 Lrp/AsnC family transcriptional regulator [Allokutzneria sp. A3M-2-11 16]